ncbi:cytochrome c biogenesis protein ResB [Dysgonomonas macrotermitis]|uniref:Respiratory nitrite reductase specific cytochrome c biogenesis protein NrfK /respiratory nitrite reductase specific cytochrome c biogenesis protein NrfL n=1 Tax=Dysgonomonas macrotermitis TaxID=1346286 RepID=A0A1M4Y624_9BACT|nr:cytochrome c biogenesis protein ResB [Dysgonomonas macrotermitis]SHF01155.1 respiratory nitrite reductase specific cytochrome c biogenesis protein NrfK /respiratory nitrite reductase specific cytochrome c biogenesis protein NrfL [Dysgonomonas macrotermitis]
MNSTKRSVWQFPWRYTESILIVIGLVIVGFALQLSVGKVDFVQLAYPLNIVVGSGMILFLLLFAFARNTQFYQWFSGVPFSVSLIGGLLVLGIAMGLIPQMQKLDPHAHDIWTLLGLTQVTSCWAFVLVYFVTLLSLGSLIVRRLIRFNWRDYAFYFNHIGLWILLFASGLGAADLRRYVMYVYEGETEWRVYSDHGDILELPIAIQLNDFVMEEYPPKLTIIDRESGKAQPEGKPDYFQIDERYPEGRLDKWELRVEKYIHQAVRNSDSTYTEVPMPGATPAVLVKITNTETGKSFSHWVCGGSIAQLYMMAPLTETLGLVMTQAEPKRFMSDIVVYTEDERVDSAELEVNKPLKVGDWMIYQYGYDNIAGKASNYSSFEMVYDPWLPAVYVGIILFAMGSVCLMWSGNKKKRKGDTE